MPLDRGCSTKAMGKNIKAMVDREGKPQDQAVAIGYSVLRKSCGVTGSDGDSMTPKEIVGAGKAKKGEGMATVQFGSTVLDERRRGRKLRKRKKDYSYGKGIEHRKIKGSVRAKFKMGWGTKESLKRYGKPIERVMAEVGKIVKKMASAVIMKTVTVDDIDIDFDKDRIRVTAQLKPKDSWVDDEVRTGNYDDADDCPQCGGSGGGPDPALRCPQCRGSGKRSRFDDDPRPEMVIDVWHRELFLDQGRVFQGRKLQLDNAETDTDEVGDIELDLSGNASDFGITKDMERGIAAGMVSVEFGRELLEREWS